MTTNIKRTIRLVVILLVAAAGSLYALSIFSSGPAIVTENQADSAKANAFLRQSDYYFSKANRTTNELDSAFLAVTNAYRVSKKADFRKGMGLSLDMYSKIYHTRGDTLLGRKYADSAIAVFKQNDLFYELGFACYNRSGFYPLDGPLLKRRIEWVKFAAEAFVESGSKLKQADIFKELGDLQQHEGDYNAALKSLHISLGLYESTNYQRLIGLYDLLGYVYGTTGNYKQALKYGLLALRLSEQLNDSTSAMVSTLHNRLGLNYERLAKKQLAYQHYDKAERISLNNKDSSNWIFIACNKANVLNTMGKRKEGAQCVLKIPESLLNSPRNIAVRGHVHGVLMVIHLDLKEYARCSMYAKWLMADLAYAKRANLSTTSMTAALAKYYFGIKDFKKAERFLNETDTVYRIYSHIPALASSYKLRIKIDSARGDLGNYIKHSTERQAMRDSLLNEQNNRDVAQMEIEYEIEKKDNDILLKEERIKLLDAENRIQQSDLRQAMLMRNVTVGGVILLMVIIALLYNRYRFNNKISQAVRQKNESLNQLVTEKEWLLKEIHHRVKNNLQIIISLLDSQSMYLKDNSALNAIRDSQSRVYCMSLIHKKLYQSDNIAAINMMRYIEELVDYLSSAFGVQYTVRFELDIAEVQLSASQSIPIGLILNEAITNSIKYAFPERSQNNTISIRLSVAGSQCRLVIRDNGVGLPAGINEENIKSLGISLMKGLSEDIDATFSIENRQGTSVEIAFRLEQPVPSLTTSDESITLTASS